MAKRKHQQDNVVQLLRESEDTYVKNVNPVTPSQAQMLEAIDNVPVVFSIGPAGTGKTYLACVKAVEYLLNGQCRKIVITRPALESVGEHLGFLPGSLENKLHPFLRPCIEALTERLSRQRFKKYLEEGVIEFVSFAHMRGRTFNNTFIIADEMQNATPEGMKMLITRIGFNSQVVICGDLTQSDLPKGEVSGLADAMERFRDADLVEFVTFNPDDVVRSEVVSELLECYDEEA
ncbi:MAG: AAA family ATPase [Proteobacteria bacterium]|nr:AAA family ATPase [Pseudomonadota bacterium]